MGIPGKNLRFSFYKKYSIINKNIYLLLRKACIFIWINKKAEKDL